MIAPARLISLLAAALALSACSLLTGRHEDLTVFAPVLAHPAPSSTTPPKRAWQLIVAEPQAVGPLNGARIVVLPKPGVIEFYKGARWRDSTPILIQQLLLQAFQESANLAGSGTPLTGLRADFVLLLDLQEFQAEYRGAQTPTVALRMNAQFVDDASDRALATHVFAVEQHCAGSDLHSVFAAFQQALNQMLPQVVEWAVQAGDANWHGGQP